jgi:hypothetical protein
LFKFVPIWIGSAVINCSLLLGAYLLFRFVVEGNTFEPPVEAEVVQNTEVEEIPQDAQDLTLEDLGMDSSVPLGYDNERIEDVNVPGNVDPTAAPGVEGADPGPLRDVPPPPGAGGGLGAGILDKDNPGTAPIGLSPGGMGGPMGGPGGFAGRSAATRQRMVLEGGGNAASEAAVASGLKFLALHQCPDGRWTLHDFNRYARTAPLPGGKIVPDNSTPLTAKRNDIAGTAFGLLPFLAAGITHKAAAKSKAAVDYTKTVNAALQYLMRKQSRSSSDRGYYGGDMYAHGLATIAMCEAYGLSSDPLLKASAQMALTYIVNCQDVGGGWRYAPRTAGDTSVTGWQLMALKSGQMAGLLVPPSVLRKCEKFLDSVETSAKGGYQYVPNSGESYTMSAVGLLCRQYLGVNPRNPGLLKGVKALKQYPPGKTDNLYYEYYATQVMHHMGGEHWQFWNLGPGGTGKGGIRDTLLAKQDKGNAKLGNKGSWATGGGDAAGGRMMATSLSLLTLEVYYRHLPLYRRDAGVMKEK